MWASINGHLEVVRHLASSDPTIINAEDSVSNCVIISIIIIEVLSLLLLSLFVS